MTAAVRRAAAAVCVVPIAVAPLAGCTRLVDDVAPRAAPQAGPIGTASVADLLSPAVIGDEGNLFSVAEPERCAGLAREVDPPLIEAHQPLATDGGHWTTDDGQFYIEEMVAVYRSDFDSAAAVSLARFTVEQCRGTRLTVTTMQDRTYDFDVVPSSAAGPQDGVLWSLRAVDWSCDNLFVAAHNAAVEITTCGAAPGYDVAGLAEDALARIDRLANTTA